MTKKIFLPGVAGFLGSHLADRMPEKGKLNLKDDIEVF